MRNDGKVGNEFFMRFFILHAVAVATGGLKILGRVCAATRYWQFVITLKLDRRSTIGAFVTMCRKTGIPNVRSDYAKRSPIVRSDSHALRIAMVSFASLGTKSFNVPRVASSAVRDRLRSILVFIAMEPPTGSLSVLMDSCRIRLALLLGVPLLATYTTHIALILCQWFVAAMQIVIPARSRAMCGYLLWRLRFMLIRMIPAQFVGPHLIDVAESPLPHISFALIGFPSFHDAIIAECTHA